MAGPWTISRDRRNGAGGADFRAVLARVGSWSRRALFTRPTSPPRAPVRRRVRLGAGPAGRTRAAGVRTVTIPGRRGATIPAERRVKGTIRTRHAVWLVAVMSITAVLLTWATVNLARQGIASSEAAVRISAGPLVSPAPRVAGGLPRRFDSINREGAGPIAAQLRLRLGAVGAGLIADARRAAAAAATADGSSQAGTSGAGAAAAANGVAARPVTAAWISGLYGQPGHIDPITGRPAWVMYLGLDATAKLGIPYEVVGRLMMGILGPYAKVGPWRVPAGHRGGSANCTVAWLAQTQVSVCGWASDHTIGAVASPTRDTSVAELAALMVKMRFDLQAQ